MKTFSVNEVAKLLGKNPETIRRWIRDGKLKADLKSKKEGHIITEQMLDAFLASSPQYAKAVTPLLKTPVGTVSVAATMVGSFLAKQYLKNERIKNAEFHPDEIKKLILEDISERQQVINKKTEEMNSLQNEIDAEKTKIIELQLLARELGNFKEDIFNN